MPTSITGLPEIFTASDDDVLAIDDTSSLVTHKIKVSNLRGAMVGQGRSLIINGSGRVNQRGYVSGTATTSANQFTLDRWYVITNGQNLAYTGGGAGRVMTAPTLGVATSVDGANVAGGTYVLSYTGTATCKVNGLPRASGDSFALSAGTAVKVVFFGGTFTDAQLELGTAPTVFEQLTFSTVQTQCERYYQRVTAGRFLGVMFTTNGDTRCTFYLRNSMRAVPTVSQIGTTSVIAFGSTGTVSNISLDTLTLGGITNTSFGITSVSNFAAFTGAGGVVSFGDSATGNLTFKLDAEIVLL